MLKAALAKVQERVAAATAARAGGAGAVGIPLNGHSGQGATAAPVRPQLPTLPTQTTAATGTNSVVMMAMERARLAAAQGIAKESVNLQQQPLQPGPSSKPAALRFDKSGKLLDEKGNVIELAARESTTLKINQRKQAEKEEKKKAKEEKHTEKVVPEEDKSIVELDPTKNPYFDKNLKAEIVSAPRARKGALHFHEQGHFQKEAESIRQKQHIEKLKKEIDERARRAGMDQLVDASVQEAASKIDSVPDIEWWDEIYLKGSTYNGVDRPDLVENSPTDPIRRELATIYVQHPVPCRLPVDGEIQPKELYLTKEEQKKIRRLKRAEAQRDEQEKIRLGLMEAPQAKAKMSNFMRILGNDAIQAPTSIEDLVRNQVQSRLDKHLNANEERKLTPQQRKEKFWDKLQGDRKKQLSVAVFKVTNLSHKLHKIKVVMNAEQLLMTGCCIISSIGNMVVVEGGPKSIKKYKRLMLHRIKWNDIDDDGNNGDDGGDDGEEHDDDDDDDDDDEERKMDVQPAAAAEEEPEPAADPSAASAASALSAPSQPAAPKGPNECVIVWEGVLKQQHFKRFTQHEFATDTLIREFVRKFRIEPYWEACKNYVSGSF